MTSKLSDRLEQIVDLLLPGVTLADIGTDHALVPEAALRRGRVTRAVAVDRSETVIEGARARLGDLGELEGRLDLRVGSGLDPLRPGEVGQVVIAGMGGPRIVQILADGTAHHRHLRQAVLQPNTDVPGVRRWLAAHDWVVVDERIVKERGQWHVQLAARPAGRWVPDMIDVYVGPVLRRGEQPEVEDWLAERLARLMANVEQAQAGGGGPPLPLVDQMRAVRDALSELRRRR